MSHLIKTKVDLNQISNWDTELKQFTLSSRLRWAFGEKRNFNCLAGISNVWSFLCSMFLHEIHIYILLCSCSQDPLFFKWWQMGKLSKIDILSTQSLLRIWTYWVLNDSSEKVQLLSTQFELRIWTYWVQYSILSTQFLSLFWGWLSTQ